MKIENIFYFGLEGLEKFIKEYQYKIVTGNHDIFLVNTKNSIMENKFHYLIINSKQKSVNQRDTTTYFQVILIKKPSFLFKLKELFL